MRIRRTILGPAILAVGTTSALVAAPIVGFAAPVAAVTTHLVTYNASAGTVAPNLVVMHA